MSLRLAVKEWAGVIQALGAGDQILLIRKYEPEQKSFLLYPTYSYYTQDKSNPERFDSKFQQKYLKTARDAALAELEQSDIVKLRYLFEVDKTVSVPKDFPVNKITPFMIWSSEHVAGYAEKAYAGLSIWIGRTKKLTEPILAARQTTGGSITTYKHFEDFKVSGAALVIPEQQYEEKRDKLIDSINATAKKSVAR